MVTTANWMNLKYDIVIEKWKAMHTKKFHTFH